MSPTWTSEQVLALSPDSSSSQNGKKLASVSKWQTLGCDQHRIWGECQGSGKDPYRTQIDLNEPAFNCNCPSRKFPCKHGLGLFLIYTMQPTAFQLADPPEWVKAWSEKRAQRQQAVAEKPKASKDPKAQAKRAAQRESKVEAGIADLKLWLQDLIRGGLAAVQSESDQFWEAPAARLVDAQASGLARQIRKLAGIPYSGDPQWPERLLERLGSIYLLLEGYQRLESLSPGTQADIRAAIGFNYSKEDLLADETALVVRDHWLILGKRTEEEDRLKVQRIWLWGQTTQQLALNLSFAPLGQPLELHSLVPGMRIEADLVFFPSGYPLRALVKTVYGDLEQISAFVGYPTVISGMAAWQTALRHQPWIETFPLSLLSVKVVAGPDQSWLVCDQVGDHLPIRPSFTLGWELFAITGGHPVDLFGEWTDQTFMPLSVFAHNQFWGLSQ